MQSLNSEFDFDMMFSYNYGDDYRSSDDNRFRDRNATEETPLITTVNNDQVEGTSVPNITSIVLLVTALLAGLGIGVYLLVLQYNDEHILPPVNMPAHLVNKSEWDQASLTVIPSKPFLADTVIIEDTGTRECSSLESCVPLLGEIKAKLGVNDSLPYNFMVSSDGTAYEGLGWSRLSPIQSELKPLFLAFIGNFTDVAPPIEEVVMAKNLIRDFLDKDLLIKNYTIRGDLYDKFKDSPQWKDIRSGFLYTV